MFHYTDPVGRNFLGMTDVETEYRRILSGLYEHARPAEQLRFHLDRSVSVTGVRPVTAGDKCALGRLPADRAGDRQADRQQPPRPTGRVRRMAGGGEGRGTGPGDLHDRVPGILRGVRGGRRVGHWWLRSRMSSRTASRRRPNCSAPGSTRPPRPRSPGPRRSATGCPEPVEQRAEGHPLPHPAVQHPGCPVQPPQRVRHPEDTGDAPGHLRAGRRGVRARPELRPERVRASPSRRSATRSGSRSATRPACGSSL